MEHEDGSPAIWSLHSPQKTEFDFEWSFCPEIKCLWVLLSSTSIFNTSNAKSSFPKTKFWMGWYVFFRLDVCPTISLLNTILIGLCANPVLHPLYWGHKSAQWEGPFNNESSKVHGGHCWACRATKKNDNTPRASIVVMLSGGERNMFKDWRRWGVLMDSIWKVCFENLDDATRSPLTPLDKYGTFPRDNEWGLTLEV